MTIQIPNGVPAGCQDIPKSIITSILMSDISECLGAYVKASEDHSKSFKGTVYK